MNRNTFLRRAALGTGALTLLNSRLFAALGVQDPWKLKAIRGNVGIFTEKGGTIAYFLTAGGIVVVDAQFPEQSQHLINELKKQSTSPFRLLINTHHHMDHTAGNISFKGLVQDVAAHANSLANQKTVAVAQKKEDQQLYPNITYQDSWKFSLDEETIRTYYYGPAHTNGDSIIHFEKANVAHMGDLVFNRRYAFVDRSAGASVRHWADVLEKTIHQFDRETIFVFGHAFDPEKVTGGKDDLRAMQDYVVKLFDYVSGAVKAGKTKDEILQTKSIPGVTEWQGDGIERGLQAAYEEVTSLG